MGVGWVASGAKVARKDSRVGAEDFSDFSSVGVVAGAEVSAAFLDSKTDGATPKLAKSSSVFINAQKASSCSLVSAVEGGEDDDGIALSVWRWGGRSVYILDVAFSDQTCVVVVEFRRVGCYDRVVYPFNRVSTMSVAGRFAVCTEFGSSLLSMVGSEM